MPGKENRPGLVTEAIVDSSNQDKIYTQYSSGSCEYESYLLGFFEGRDSRQAEVDALNWTADRLYTELCRRPAPRTVDRPTFASLQATRTAIHYAAVTK